MTIGSHTVETFCVICMKSGIFNRKYPSSWSQCLYQITSVICPKGIHFQTLVVQLTLSPWSHASFLLSAPLFSLHCYCWRGRAPSPAPSHQHKPSPLFHLHWHWIIQLPIGALPWNISIYLIVLTHLIITLELHSSQLEVSLIKR